MRQFVRVAAVLALASLVSAASASIVFSNVTISGSVSTGATFTDVSPSIDFFFPNATVGDPVDPIRTGELMITYEATSSAQLVQDRLVLSVLGALSGSGTIFVNEVVEELSSGDILATHSALLSSTAYLPHVAVLDFTHPSDHVKIKKTFVLNAVPDTQDFDIASVGLVE